MEKQEPINAYDLYCQALEIAVDIAAPIRPSWADDGQPAQRFVAIKTIKAYTSDQIGEMLESNRESMALIREGLQHKCHIPMMDTVNTKLLQVTTLANLFLLEAWQQTALHNIEGAIGRLSEMMRFGVHISNGGTYMGGMFCSKVLDRATMLLSTLLKEIDFDSALKASRMLQEFLDLSPVIAKAIEGEIKFNKAGMNVHFEKEDWKSSLSGVDDVLLSKSQIKKNRAFLEPLLKEDILSMLNDLYTHMRLKVTLPFQEAVKLPKLPKNGFNDMQDLALSVRFALLQKQCYLSMLQIAFALEAYKLKNAGYPCSLESLVPEYLENIPLDPFAESSSIKYIPDLSPYILYSVGPDGKDSKGKAIKSDITEKSKGDIVFEISAGEYPMQYTGLTFPDIPKKKSVVPRTSSRPISEADCEFLCNEFTEGLIESECAIFGGASDGRSVRYHSNRYVKASKRLMKHPTGQAALAKLFDHEDALVRLTAAMSLADINYSRAVETLRELADGPEGSIVTFGARGSLQRWEETFGKQADTQ